MQHTRLPATVTDLAVHRLSILSAEVDVVTPEQVMDFLSGNRKGRCKAVIANHNMHSLYLFQTNATMRRLYDKAALIEIDSVPMIVWARLMGHEVTCAHRCTYLDFRESFWSRAEAEGWRVYHVGGAVEHNAISVANIQSRYPEVVIRTHSGYFDVNGAENDELVGEIVAFNPDILLVGMGMPRQEIWILDNYDHLPPCSILPVGAAFDYEAEVIYIPPRWAGQMGIEWLLRFLNDPTRLFARYFLEPWVLMPQFLADIRRRLTNSAPIPASVPTNVDETPTAVQPSQPVR